MSLSDGAIYFGVNFARVCCVEPEGTVIYREEQQIRFLEDDLREAYMGANAVHSIISIIIQTVAREVFPSTASLAVGHACAFGLVTYMNENTAGYRLDQHTVRRIAFKNFALNIIIQFSSNLCKKYINK